MDRYTRLLRYALGQWPSLILIFGLTAATSGVTALQPWPMKLLVDYALGDMTIPEPLRSVLEGFSLGPAPMTLILTAAATSLGLLALSSALDVGVTWAWAAAGQRMVYDLGRALFHRLQRLSLRFHSRRSVGDSLSRLTADTYCVYTVTDALLITPWLHLFTLGTLGAIAWNLDPGLARVSLIAAPVLAGSAVFFGPRLKRLARQDREAQSRLLSFVHQTLTAIPVVQAFSTEAHNRQRFRRLAADVVARSQRGVLLKDTYGSANELAMVVATAVVLYVGGQRVLSGALSVGSLLVFLAYMRSIMNGFRGLLSVYGSLKSTEASIDRVLEVLDFEETIKDAPGARALPASGPGPRGSVCLEGVSFGYEPGRPVLQDITIEARSGETIALVGPTGAGKSTLVCLIPRFFDPWKGQVRLDGWNVRSIQLTSLRAQVALVPQEPFLLPLTVAENIAYGRLGASHAEVMAAALAANADEFIQRLPQGYDTVIGERGTTLSAGERQRLAIARALLKDAPVLILDEPTSALDSRTEGLLLEALERLMAGRTTFVITHRLSTVRWADRIVVLDQGKVAQVGTHQELLALGGVYRNLYSLQASGPPLEASP